MPSLMMKIFRLPALIPEPVYFLNSVRIRHSYVDGKRTDEVDGYVYTATNTGTYDQISVLVEGKKPLITPEKLDELHEAGESFFVEFDNAIVRPYYSERSHEIVDSIKADAVRQVKTE